MTNLSNIKTIFFLVIVSSLMIGCSGEEDKPPGGDPPNTEEPEAVPMCAQCAAKECDACKAAPECSGVTTQDGASCCDCPEENTNATA